MYLSVNLIIKTMIIHQIESKEFLLSAKISERTVSHKTTLNPGDYYSVSSGFYNFSSLNISISYYSTSGFNIKPDIIYTGV